MAPALLFVIVLFTIIVWRLLFASLHRPLLRETAEQHNNIVEQGPQILRQNDSDGGVYNNARQQPAETYLHRIVALTGATRSGNYYVLHAGKAQFHVRDRNVKRIPDGADPAWARWETCFHPAHQHMTAEEQIASVLLQLKSNPSLFDSWTTKRELAFKADGQMFNRPK
jgi:hypothetical protein